MVIAAADEQPGAETERTRKYQATVIVGVFANQVDASWSELGVLGFAAIEVAESVFQVF